ncbi:MAG TPA: hypothetical protein VM843_07150 [Flavisolibacter sp.]|nr:hypothetical protein [Flavisolibacter sp.]
MKKILIVTYYFPPYTGIEGHRPDSWYRYFRDLGLSPIVVTRHWTEGATQTWEDYQTDSGTDIEIERTERGEVHRLPYRAYKEFKKWGRKKLLGGAWYWLQKAKGNLHIETDCVGNFLEYCRGICRSEKPDYILVSSAPLNIIYIGHQLEKEFGIPYLADFKDSYNNRLLKINYKLTLKEQVEKSLFLHYVTKWLQNSFAVAGVCWPVIDMVNEKAKRPAHLVMNGFDEEEFAAINYKPDQVFRITILGTIYAHQEIDFMVAGFAGFLKTVDADNILIQFIGLGDHSPVSQKLKAALPARNLLITKRLPRKEALEFLTATTILYYPGWRGYRGIYSGKIFEYLCTRLPILIGPGDEDVIDELLLETDAGKSAYTPAEMSSTLVQWYHMWTAGEKIPYSANERLNQYSNWNQARIMAEIFHGESSQ